ncbi:MAG: OmpA family protein, partial [Alphaproteobacteria bacterium]
MRLKLIAVLSALTLVGACASQSETGSAGSSAGDSQVGASSGSAPAATSVSQTPANEGVDMLSKNYFIANVGDRVFFGFDQSAITAEASTVLARQAAWLNGNPTVTVRIEGHADERGTREYNLALGERRANAVREYLMSQGVS